MKKGLTAAIQTKNVRLQYGRLLYYYLLQGISVIFPRRIENITLACLSSAGFDDSCNSLLGICLTPSRATKLLVLERTLGHSDGFAIKTLFCGKKRALHRFWSAIASIRSMRFCKVVYRASFDSSRFRWTIFVWNCHLSQGPKSTKQGYFINRDWRSLSKASCLPLYKHGFFQRFNSLS